MFSPTFSPKFHGAMVIPFENTHTHTFKSQVFFILLLPSIYIGMFGVETILVSCHIC